MQVETAATDADKPADSTFGNGVLTTPELQMKIVNYKIIPVGQVGNDPVLAIWYDTTNLVTPDKDITPMMAFFTSFGSVQRNNPNAENTLNIGMRPDRQFLDSQIQGRGHGVERCGLGAD